MYDETLAVWAQVADIAEDNPDLWFGRAVAYGLKGQLKKAIGAFEQFQQLASTEVHQLGIDKMIEELKKEQQGEIAPGSFLYEHLNSQLEDNFDLGDYDLVERKARQMIDIDDGRPEGHFTLGLALLQHQKPGEALAAFLDAHALEHIFQSCKTSATVTLI